MKGDIFDNFSWHSSIGIDESIKGSRQFVTQIPNTERTRRQFVASGAGDDNFLIHKTTHALWRVSDDKQTIEPVFSTDVLTEELARELTGDDDES